MEKKFGAITSSTDPEKISLTVMGAVRAVAGILVFAGIFTATDANTLLEQVAIVVPMAVSAYGAVEIIIGIFRKVLVQIFQKRQ